MGGWKYFAAFTVPAVTFAALWRPESLCFATVIYSFVVIPLVESLFRPNPANADEDREPALLANRLYDWLLYAMVPVQHGLLTLFLVRTADSTTSITQLAGMTASMGVNCGAVGINVAHELGHRVKRFEQILARLLLLTSLYMHFTIEHNRGHHKRVATPQDPSTGRRDESLYRFWMRCIPGVFLSAWHIASREAQNRNHSRWGLSNELVRFVVLEVSFVVAVAYFAGMQSAACFLAAALTGILMLETVNYVEHYGLVRKEFRPGKYERVQPRHSWNSDHVLGRIMLFELTRHADHHYSASRKYQILRHLPDGPQLPVGYPTAMLLTMLPPLWFRLVHPQLDRLADESLTAQNADD